MSSIPAAPDAGATPLPAAFGLTLDPTAQLRRNGTVIMGGSPLRVVRLHSTAADMLARWRSGEKVGDDRTAGLVARRLVRQGVVQPVPFGPGPDVHDVTVVVPVRDRPGPLAALLDSLDGLAVVVVDDASADADTTRVVAQQAGAGYVRLDPGRGPGGARDAGLAVTRSELVAFVDSDCIPPPGWLPPLLAHFADPLVAAVAPRIRPTFHPAGGWRAEYEMLRSPLDRGPSAGLVAPAGRVSFVPTAALVVRRDALGSPCFDPDLQAGEDVDLVWRLEEAGWDVRYEPAAVVHHARDDTLSAWAARRAVYGSTAGPLARRHPHDLAPVVTGVWSAAAWALTVRRKPLWAAGVVGVSVAVLADRLHGVVDDPVRTSIRIAGLGTLRGAIAAQSGATRALGPAIVAGVLWRRSRMFCLFTLLAPAISDWHQAASREGSSDLEPSGSAAALGPARYVAAHLLDDLSYSVGVWIGCWRARTVRPLLPRVELRSRPWSRAAIRGSVGRSTRGSRTAPGRPPPARRAPAAAADAG